MEKAFRSLPAQGPLNPVFEVTGVFNHRNLAFTFGGQSKAKAIVGMPWESL